MHWLVHTLLPGRENTMEHIARDAADHSTDRVEQRLSPDWCSMSTHVAAGYVRARARRTVTDEVAHRIAQQTHLAHDAERITERAIDLVVQCFTRRHMVQGATARVDRRAA